MEAIDRGRRRYDTPRFLETRKEWWRHGAHGPGEANGFAKLTESEVRALRRRYAEGERQVDLAAAFGLGQTHVSRIVRREAWGHVPEENDA